MSNLFAIIFFFISTTAAFADTTIPIRRAETIMYAAMTVNNTKGRFIIDPDKSLLCVTKRFATKMAKTHTVFIRVGGSLIANLEYQVCDPPLPGYDGIVGSEFLKRFDVLVKESEMILSPAIRPQVVVKTVPAIRVRKPDPLLGNFHVYYGEDDEPY